MGILLKLVDFTLFLFFLLITIVAPLIDAQTCLPLSYFPEILVNVKTWYTNEYGDYLVADKPHFFVGLVWLELLFQWPLAVLNVYAILSSKGWFNTTCLIYGVSLSTSMVFPFSFKKFIFFQYLIIYVFDSCHRDSIEFYIGCRVLLVEKRVQKFVQISTCSLKILWFDVMNVQNQRIFKLKGWNLNNFFL